VARTPQTPIKAPAQGPGQPVAPAADARPSAAPLPPGPVPPAVAAPVARTPGRGFPLGAAASRTSPPRRETPRNMRAEADAAASPAPRPPSATTSPLKTGLPTWRWQPEPEAGWTAPALAWITSLLALGGGLLALWRYREAVVVVWPPAGRLLALLGGG
jgi:hypothetical protein